MKIECKIIPIEDIKQLRETIAESVWEDAINSLLVSQNDITNFVSGKLYFYYHYDDSDYLYNLFTVIDDINVILLRCDSMFDEDVEEKVHEYFNDGIDYVNAFKLVIL